MERDASRWRGSRDLKNLLELKPYKPLSFSSFFLIPSFTSLVLFSATQQRLLHRHGTLPRSLVFTPFQAFDFCPIIIFNLFYLFFMRRLCRISKPLITRASSSSSLATVEQVFSLLFSSVLFFSFLFFLFLGPCADCWMMVLNFSNNFFFFFGKKGMPWWWFTQLFKGSRPN